MAAQDRPGRDARGRRIIVTGATSGVGMAMAEALGRAGAALVLACRDTARGNVVAQRIRDAGGATSVDVVAFDAADDAAIQAMAAEVARRWPRVDVLIDNAGLVSATRQETGEGIERVFATNVLGYHRVTQALLPGLVAAAPSRVVVVASAFAGHLDLDDLEWRKRPYTELDAYAQSKACNRLWAWALARRVRECGVTVNAMTPGFVPGTGLSRNLSPELRATYERRTGRTLEEGADTAVWLATAPELDGVTSRFFADRREQTCEFRREADEERLWAVCQARTSVATVP